MSDYEYGNARLRAMRSKLLSRRELDLLTETGSVNGLIVALTKTTYQKPIEAALTRSIGMECIDEALRSDLITTINGINGFYHEDTRKLVALALRIYDIGNLKTILRGLSKDVSSGEIISLLLPIGELNLNTLRELARLNNPREAIDLLASQSSLFAAPLLKLRVEHPGADIFEMELALDQWHFHQLHQVLRNESEAASLAYALALEVDLVNLLTILRFAHAPRKRDTLRDKFGSEDLAPLFVSGGKISIETFANAGRQESVSAAIQFFTGTPFEPALRAGFEAYSRSNRLSDIEKQLRRYRLTQLALLIQKDSLGIGVVLGYIALKVCEIGNIRWIAQGINMDLKTDAIQAELEMIV